MTHTEHRARQFASRVFAEAVSNSYEIIRIKICLRYAQSVGLYDAFRDCRHLRFIKWAEKGVYRASRLRNVVQQPLSVANNRYFLIGSRRAQLDT